MSVESVAAEAGVSRASVYRRFRSKADLVTAAIARSIPPPDHGTAVGDPRRALVAYLEQFEDRFAESCLEVIGSLSGTREEPGALALHRERVVGPRLAYGRFLLELAQARGELAADADLDVALHMLAGSVLCHRVSGATPGPGWAERAVDAVWSGMAQSGLAQSGIDQSDMAPGTRPT
jgi:AcrR family transcriptional regulator